jgi:predicted permease
MLTVFLNAFSLFLVILLGFFMKRIGLLGKADGNKISLIIINITLPAAIFVNLVDLIVKADLLLLIALGFLLNVLMIFVGFFASKGQNATERQFIMYSTSGYNIGNFSLPFVQSFFPLAVPFLSMFDMGNSIMLAGGSNVLIEGLVGKKAEVNPLKILVRLFKSPPYTVYVVMLIVRLLKIDLPDPLVNFIQIPANANTFLSMFMIGLYLDLKMPKGAGKLMGKVLATRYLGGLILAGFFAILPLPHLVKLVLCLLSVAPIATFGVINSVLAGENEETVGITSSASFMISLVLMTGVVVLLS